MDSDPLILFPRPAGAVDHRGGPVARSATGRWTSALFIIGVELAERSAYNGISLNLITYLTGNLGESTAAAAAGVNTWSGVALMTPLLGAFIADSYLGRYRTIAVASVFYVLGLGMLTLSAILPSLSPQFQVALFYFALYLVAFAQGGHKPCVQAFGADQFDENDPQEFVARSSFFNWWYFGMNAGMIVSLVVLSYIQDNISWGLGFGIPCILMVIALVVFLMGTKSYRYYLLEDQSLFARVGKAFAILINNGDAHSKTSNKSNSILEEGETRRPQASDKSKAEEHGDALSIAHVEEAKGVLRLFPIWATCLAYAIVCAQLSTFFTKQGSTVDRRIGLSYQVPPAALQSFICVAIPLRGIGSFISSFLVSVIDRITTNLGESWFSNNLNSGHLDYFYWLLAGLSAAGLLVFMYFAHAFVYKNKGTCAL